MLRICFKQPSEEGYSRGEGRHSRELEGSKSPTETSGSRVDPEFTPENPAVPEFTPQDLEFTPENPAVTTRIILLSINRPTPLCQDQSSSSS